MVLLKLSYKLLQYRLDLEQIISLNVHLGSVADTV